MSQLHHPLVEKLDKREVSVPSGMRANFLGVKTRIEFESGMAQGKKLRDAAQSQQLPGFNEEYFEWVDILEAVLEARERFVMFELGAGYGRWLVRAVTMLRQLNPMPFELVAVEAEPTHFLWLQQHLTDNDIEPSAHRLIQAAIHADVGFADFHVGNPGGWYGQAIDAHTGVRSRRSLWMRMEDRLRRRRDEEPTRRWVETVRLAEILTSYPRIDLIDLDIQGAELKVLEGSIDELNERVRRVHIGTHGSEIEAGLRVLFAQHGWTCLNDYSALETQTTPYGEIKFDDGVQTWVNPRLE